MASSLHQAQAEGLCLRFPENLGPHREINYELAANMLSRAISMASARPFSWGYIDQPPEGQLFLLFLPLQSAFPIDGLRFQDQEVKFTIPVGTSRELEVHEVKFGFIPGSQDTSAWRLRRRYRLVKGGNLQLVLAHYTQGPQTPIVPALMNQPVRNYPLRMVNEPSVYVAGDKMGQKVPLPGTGGPPPSSMSSSAAGPPPSMQQQPGMPMNFSQQQAMVGQQSNHMRMLEQRREQERARNRMAGPGGRPMRPDEDDSGDEVDQISTRTLALNRYRRNHDLMNEVFRFAAFGDKNATSAPPRPFSIFDKAEIEEKTAKLQQEIEVLQAKKAERVSARERENLPVDIPLEMGITA